jgi:hypothetical protein
MNMPKKQIAIPQFRTEAEETEWWDSHPEVVTEIMERAIKIRQGEAATRPFRTREEQKLLNRI